MSSDRDQTGNVAPLPTVNFGGVAVDAVTYEEILARVDAWLKNKGGRSRHLACVNAYCVALASRDKRLARIYNGADLVGPDGMPFVYWIRTFLRRRCDRVAAPETLLELAKRARVTGYTFYLYGGAPDVVARMKEYLEKQFPYIRIVGYRSPPFRPLTEEEDKAICEEINALAPDILCVGLGTPKQDYWIEDHLYRIRGSVMVASGATFDFFGGRVKMAPEFIRRSGFEWLYRLLGRDFKRLWRRYLIWHGVFVWNFVWHLVGLNRRPADRWVRPQERVLAEVE